MAEYIIDQHLTEELPGEKTCDKVDCDKSASIRINYPASVRKEQERMCSGHADHFAATTGFNLSPAAKKILSRV